MGHDHSHHHHHGHSHAPKNFTRAFAIGITLNLAFVAVEAGYGFFANSLSLVADAGHNLSDVAGLALAWAAAWLSTKKPSAQFTYGFGQTSILAALANALFLLMSVGFIVWEAIERLQAPEPMEGTVVILVATIGILINGFTAYLFMSGTKTDLNIRGAYLHMAADALVSAGVVISGFIFMATGWLWLDPMMSIVIAVVITVGTWRLLTDSVKLAMAGVPSTVDVEKVRAFLSTLKGVSAVHDLHVWAMSTNETAMTAHLVMPAGHPGDKFLKQIAHDLDHDYQVQHVTVQIEINDGGGECRQESDDVV